MRYPAWSYHTRLPQCPHCAAQLNWQWLPSQHPAQEIWMQGCAGALLGLCVYLPRNISGNASALWLGSAGVYYSLLAMIALVLLPFLCMQAGWVAPEKMVRLGRFVPAQPDTLRESSLWLYPLAFTLMPLCLMAWSEEPPAFMVGFFIVALLLSSAPKSWAMPASFAAVGLLLWLTPALAIPVTAALLLALVMLASTVSIAWFAKLHWRAH